jgi:transposase
VEMKVRFCGATIKTVVAARGQGLRDGDIQVVRRATALLEVGEGHAVAVVASRVGRKRATIYRWLHAFIVEGVASLRSQHSPGRPAKLTPSQKKRLSELLEAGPLGAGYPTGCWSAVLIQDLIYQEFGRLYNSHYLTAFLRNLGFSYQKARFISDHLNPERRRVWREEEWPAILRLARARGALLLFGDEASFAQWGSWSYTWARRGQQPLVTTCGKRKAYKVFGLIDYLTGRLFAQGQTARFTAETYCAFLAHVLAATDQPILLVQDGAKYHTAATTQAFFITHRPRLTVYQLPSYSPDYNPIEHLWKNMKKRTTHLRYFPSFEALVASVEEGLTHFQHHPAAVKQVMGTTLATLGDQSQAA